MCATGLLKGGHELGACELLADDAQQRTQVQRVHLNDVAGKTAWYSLGFLTA